MKKMLFNPEAKLMEELLNKRLKPSLNIKIGLLTWSEVVSAPVFLGGADLKGFYLSSSMCSFLKL